MTILPPVRLKVDPALRGKARRQAAGAALQDIMTDSAVLTTPIDQTLFEALVVAHQTRDTGKPVIEDPLGTKLTYKKLIVGAQVLGAKLAPMLPPQASVRRRAAAELRRRRGDVLRAADDRPRAGDAQFLRPAPQTFSRPARRRRFQSF